MITCQFAWEPVLALGLSDYMIGGTTLAGIAVLLAVAAIRRRDSGPDSRQYRREIESAIREHAAVRGDIERLMKELEELAQRVGSLIEAKTDQLERAIAEADRRIQALHTTQPTSTASAAQHPDELASEPSSVPDLNETLARHSAIYALADQGQSPVEIARQTEQTVGEIELILNLRQLPRGAVEAGISIKA